jgi:hypothetical protein
MNVNYTGSVCAAEPAFRFCWLRESMPSHVDHDSGFLVARRDLLVALLGLHPAQHRSGPRSAPVTIDDLEAGRLPDWAVRKLGAMIGPCRSGLAEWNAVAARVRETAACIPGVAELHLPHIDRRRWPRRLHVLESTEFAARGASVMPEEVLNDVCSANEYLARVVGATAVKGFADVPLHCWFDKRANGPVLDVLLPASVARVPAVRPVDVHVDYTLNPYACSAWLRTPEETRKSYHPIHSKVSVAVQRVLRRWIAFDWFDDLRLFEDTLTSHAVLAYSAMTPYVRRIRSEFTYDTMDPDWMESIFVHSRAALRTVLRATRRELLNLGYKRLASEYFPAYAKYIMERAKKQRRCLHQLVETENGIVNRLLRMGVELRGERSARCASATAAECASNINTRLRRLLNVRDCTALGAIVMFEATNALHEALGGGRALRAEVTIEEAPASLSCGASFSLRDASASQNT